MTMKTQQMNSTRYVSSSLIPSCCHLSHEEVCHRPRSVGKGLELHAIVFMLNDRLGVVIATAAALVPEIISQVHS